MKSLLLTALLLFPSVAAAQSKPTAPAKDAPITAADTTRLLAALRTRPTDATLQYQLGQAYTQAGRATAALPLFERLYATDSTHADLTFSLGLARLNAAQPDWQPLLDRALALAPTDATLRATYADVLDTRGEGAAALPLWASAVRLDSTRAPWIVRLANAYREADLADLAARTLTRAARRLPHEPILWNELGLLLADRDAPDSAAAAFGRALTLRPEEPTYWSNRATVRLNHGDGDGALSDFDAALRLAPGTDALLSGRGLALLLLQRNDAAQVAFEQATTVAPDEADHHGNLADALIRRRQPVAARAALDRAQRLAPNEPYYGYLRALTFLDEGNFVAADSVMRPVLAADPQMAAARFEMGQIQAGQQRPLQAIAYYQQAIDLGYSNPAEAYYRIGLIHYLTNKSSKSLETAQSAFTSALTADPDARKAEIDRYLGEIRRELNALRRLNGGK